MQKQTKFKDQPQTFEKNDEEATKSKLAKLPVKQPKEKPALSPIQEETDTPDSSGDSAVNFRDLGNFTTTKKSPYDVRVSLHNDYVEVVRDHGEETSEDKRRDESPPFLTARNASDREGKSCDSSATTSYEGNSPEDDEEQEDSSLGGESTSGDVDYYYYDDDYDDNDLETVENDLGSVDNDLETVDNDLETVDNDLEIVDEKESENLFGMSRKMRKNHRRPKSAPSCSLIESSDTSRDDKFGEITTTLDWLKARVVKSERDIFDLKKQLSVEKTRGRNLAKRYEDDRNVTRESLRIDLELWIKRLNDGLKGYLGEWQKRERLRLNEEISRISDLYSQEIAKSLKISLKEWQTEESKNIFEVIERREKSCEDKERVNAKAVYEKIQTHLENLEKRNRKSYAGLCKQIDKWEERLRDEIVKIHEEDLKKLRQQVNTWYEDGRKSIDDPSVNRQKSKERCTEMKRSSSFLGSEALLQVEENLLKRLRDRSSKDLRRTEQIVKTELKSQRRELAKRMNDKIGELWLAFEEFGCSSSIVDRGRSKGRNDLDECRSGITGNVTKDTIVKPDVFGGGWIGGKIIRSTRPGRSNISNSDIEDGDRDFGEDEDENETTGESSENKRNILDKLINSPTLLSDANLPNKKKSFTNHPTDRGEK